MRRGQFSDTTISKGVLVDCSKCRTLLEIKNAVAACDTCPGRRADCAETCKTFAGLRAKCLACNADNDQSGLVHVIKDAIGGALKIDPVYAFGLHPDRSTPITPLSPEAEEAAAAVLYAFADLAPWELPIVHALLNHAKGEAAAHALGLNSRQAYHARLKKAIAAHPWIASLHIGRSLGIKTTVSKNR